MLLYGASDETMRKPAVQIYRSFDLDSDMQRFMPICGSSQTRTRALKKACWHSAAIIWLMAAVPQQALFIPETTRVCSRGQSVILCYRAYHWNYALPYQQALPSWSGHN